MKLLDNYNKQLLFGMAGAKAAKTAAKPKTRKTTKKSTANKKAPDVSGMMMASEFPISDAKKKPSERGKKKTTTTRKSKKIADPSRYDVYKNINKIGLMALAGGAIVNHTINTTHKMIAAIEGNSEKFKYYEDKNKNYMKPHFSLPSQWHQPRITFGTPWYY